MARSAPMQVLTLSGEDPLRRLSWASGEAGADGYSLRQRLSAATTYLLGVPTALDHLDQGW